MRWMGIGGNVLCCDRCRSNNCRIRKVRCWVGIGMAILCAWLKFGDEREERENIECVLMVLYLSVVAWCGGCRTCGTKLPLRAWREADPHVYYQMPIRIDEVQLGHRRCLPKAYRSSCSERPDGHGMCCADQELRT
ncbi:hypothetical protein IQ06DRAFT_588 [Phaeosphaeriaceae sp. SRC1lsM3a]|nr:hypothetical protein IQ06DRAFT_588 [Stagonospora sp. SRC1lsM3a]